MPHRLLPGTGPTSGGDDDGSTFWSSIVGVPSVLRNLSDSAKALLRDPRTYIIGVVLEWLVGGVLEFLASVLHLVLEAFGQLAGVPMMLAEAVALAGGVAGDAFLMPWRVVADLVAGLVAVTGPFAPIVVAIWLWIAVEILIRLVNYILKLINPA